MLRARLVTVQPAATDQEDEIFASLADLVAATDELRRGLSILLGTMPVKNLRGTAGLSYGQIMPLNKRIQIIELISDAYKSVTEAAGRFRQAEVKALYDEGMTMDEIAAVLCVTRQRVSALLRQASVHLERPSTQRAAGLPATSEPGLTFDAPRNGGAHVPRPEAGNAAHNGKRHDVE
jgi:hypothetical protein